MGRRRLLVFVAVLAGLTGATLEQTRVLERIENDTVDARFAVRGSQPADDLAVVAIDEETFGELQATWPLSRRHHARVIDRLHAAGARLIVYDVQFTEPSQDPDADYALFESVRRAGDVILATGESDGRGGTAVLGGPEMLAEADAVAAAANLPADRWGVLRHYTRRVADLPSMATAAGERLGRPLEADAFDEDGRAWIDFRGGPRSIPTYSFSDVRRGRVAAARFRDRVVVVGASAPTLQDVHATATTAGVEMAGPEVQANAISTALRGNPLRDSPGWIGLLSALALGAVAPALALRRRLAIVFGVVAVLCLGHLAVAQLAFARGTVMPVVAPLVSLWTGALGALVVRYLSVVAERLIIRRSNERLEREVAARTSDLREAQLELVHRLAQAAERRDGGTGEHIERMSTTVERLALGLGFGADDAERLRHASALHDVGKIAIPDDILLKPGPLSDAERRLMQTHATVGGEMLAGSRSPLLQLAESVARTHHEKWDGSGYPAGLRGEEIPLAGRICAVCDVFDALTSERPYKPAWSESDALAEIAAEAGRHFDPRVVDTFLALFEQRPLPAAVARA